MQNKKKDYIVRAVAAGSNVRAFAISSTNMVEEARNTHKCTPVITALLGRLLSAGAMMASMMKGEKDILTIHMRGDGPARSAVVTADGKGNVKGYAADPFVDIPLKGAGKLDVGGAIGRGTLSVSMDLGLKEPYSGQCEIQTGEVGDDLAYYFTVSQQTPSAVGLGVMVDRDQSVRHAGGFIIQLMPYAPEEVIAKLEERISMLDPVTTMMENGMGPEDILETILGDMGLEITETMETRFRCDCSKQKVSRALATLNRKDLDDIIADGEEIEVRCHFCNKAYTFGIDEIKMILSLRDKS